MGTEFIKSLSNKSGFDVVVKTNQKKNEIRLSGENILLLMKEKPENNKANQEIERFLSKITGKQAKIIKGKTSKNKTIKLS